MAGDKASIILGRGHVTLGTDDSALKKGLANAAKDFQAWGKSIGALGVSLAALGASIVAPMLVGLSGFAEQAGAASRAGRELGLGFEETQSLAGAMRTDIDGLSGAVVRMDRFLQQAANGSHRANTALQQLGLTFDQLNDMTQSERIRAFADGLARIPEGQRLALQRQILGNVHLDLRGGAAGVQQREERVRHLGGVISEEDRSLADAYNLSLREMGIATRGLWASIGAAAAPAMTQFFQLITQAVIGIRQMVEANRPLLETIFRVADGMVTTGAILGVLGGVVYASAYAFTALSSMLGVTAVATWAYHAALSAAAGGFGLVTAATWAWSATTAIASAALAVITSGFGIVTAAGWLYSVGMWTIIGVTGQMTVANWAYAGSMSAQQVSVWLSTAALWAWSAAGSVMSGILWALGPAIWLGTAAIWLFNAAWAASVAVMAWFGASAVAATAATGGYSIGATIASIVTALFTGGISLLTGALSILGAILIPVGAALLALGGVAVIAVAIGAAAYYAGDALSSLTFRFASLHSSLGFLDDAVDWLKEMWASFMDSAVGGWLREIVGSMESLWATAIGVYEAVMRWADDTGVSEFLANIGHIVVAAGTLAVYAAYAAGYLAYLGYEAIRSGAALRWLGGIWEWVTSLFSGEGGGYFSEMFADLAGAIGHIVQLLGSAVRWIAGVLGALFSPMIELGRSMEGAIVSATSNVLGAICQITSVLSTIGSAVSSAVSTTVDAFAGLFSGLVSTATAAWGGVMNAFRVGDWELLWDILKASALLAWEKLKLFGLTTFYAWKAAFVDVAYALGDYLYDVFQGVWTQLKILFVQGWAFIQIGFYDIIEAIVNVWQTAYMSMVRRLNSISTVIASVSPMAAAAIAALAPLSGLSANQGTLDAIAAARTAAGNQGRTETARIEREAIGDWFATAMERVNREMELDAARAQEQAGLGGNREEVNRLQRELDDFNAYAQFLQDATAVSVPQGPGGDQRFQPGGAAGGIQGGFSVGALMGVLSGSMAESPAQAIARVGQQQREMQERQHADQMALLREIARVAGDRFT